MTRRLAPLLLALALLLRLAVPAGMMPAARGDAVVLIDCPSMGRMAVPANGHRDEAPAPADCPFGMLAAPVLPTPPVALAPVSPPVAVRLADRPARILAARGPPAPPPPARGPPIPA